MAPCVSYGFLHEYRGDRKKLYPTDRHGILLEIVRNEDGVAEVWIHAKIYQQPLLRVTQEFGEEFTDAEIIKTSEVLTALLKAFGPNTCPCCGK